MVPVSKPACIPRLSFLRRLHSLRKAAGEVPSVGLCTQASAATRTNAPAVVAGQQGLLLRGLGPGLLLHTHTCCTIILILFSLEFSPALEEVATSRWGHQKPWVLHAGRDPSSSSVWLSSAPSCACRSPREKSWDLSAQQPLESNRWASCSI